MSASDAASLSFWSVGSNIGFLFVIVGVVLEGIEAYFWIVGWLGRKQLKIIWIKPPEPHVPRWAHTIDHWGWFILVVGLALEFWGHIRIAEITDREGRRLTAQLDSATQQASSAFLLAAKIGTTNAWLVQSNLALQAKLQPRNIAENDKIKFIESLRRSPNGPKGYVTIFFYTEEGNDVPNFANDILDVFSRAMQFGELPSVHMVNSYGAGGMTQIPAGLFIDINATNQLQAPFANEIVEAFKAIGFDCIPRIDHSMDTNEVRIFVGVKP